MRHALVCEVSFPLHPKNGNDPTQIRNMKRTPLPKHEVFDLPEFHQALHEAIPRGKKYVIDVLAKRLSQRGEFTDYFDRFPEDWGRLSEMRGR